MTIGNSFILATLGGALVGGLLATLLLTKKESESFPLSPANEPNNLRGTAAENTDADMMTEMREELHPS
jgi:hypothetical protein